MQIFFPSLPDTSPAKGTRCSSISSLRHATDLLSGVMDFPERRGSYSAIFPRELMSMLVGKILCRKDIGRSPRRRKNICAPVQAVPKPVHSPRCANTRPGTLGSKDRAPTACRAASGACPRLLASIAVSLLFSRRRPQNVTDQTSLMLLQTDHSAPKSLLCPENRRRSRAGKQRT